MKRVETSENNFIGYDRLDRCNTLPYDKRYLDALASILLVKGNNYTVAAVCYYDNKFYLSYNRTPIKIKDREILKEILDEIWGFVNEKNWSKLLVFHLMYNQIDFQGMLSTYLNFYKNIPLEIEKEVKKYLESIKSPDEAKKIGEGAIFDNYFKLLDSVSNSKKPISNDFKQILFRPLQNVTKLCYFLKHNNSITIDLDNLILIDNNIKNLHAELNIKQHFPVINEKYIGVSRLCCAACHKVLETYNDGDSHRGTHGVCYDAWSFPLRQFENVIKSLQYKADTLIDEEFKKSQDTETNFRKDAGWILETRFKVKQQRDLSDDEDLEEIIPIEFKEEQLTLWQLKVKLLGRPEGKSFEDIVDKMIKNPVSIEDIVKYVQSQYSNELPKKVQEWVDSLMDPDQTVPLPFPKLNSQTGYTHNNLNCEEQLGLESSENNHIDSPLSGESIQSNECI